MSLFSKQPKATSLASESAEIIDVFTRTKERLQTVNTDIVSEQASLDAKIESLNAQKALLDQTQSRNESVIANIDKILQ
jgi:septal ring factor EnvC (AmiA/AmiB activator)